MDSDKTRQSSNALGTSRGGRELDARSDARAQTMHHTALAIAREALHRLASRKLPPTPDNYAKIYYEIASPGSKAGEIEPAAMLRELLATIERRSPTIRGDVEEVERAIDGADWDSVKNGFLKVLGADYEATRFGALWCQLISDLMREWESHTAGLTRARKREGLEHVLTTFSGNSELLYARLGSLIGSWKSSPKVEKDILLEELAPAPEVAVPPPTPPAAGSLAAAVDEASEATSRAAELVRELLATTLTVGIVERMGYPFELAREARELADMTRAAHTPDAVDSLGAKMKHLWVALELRGDEQREIQQGLLRLLNILCGNVGELMGDDSWLRGQLKVIAKLTEGPIDRDTLAALERGLREVVLKQGVLKQSLDQAKDALKNMVTTFIDRLGTMADSASGYHDRMQDYATRIESADNLPELSDLISQVMHDTRSAQTDMARSRDDLLAARRQADEYQDRIVALQKELAAVSDRAHEDPLTQLPNRRGLTRAYEVEASRADRKKEPMCLSILDVDNFKVLNDTFGHQAGDEALVHLASVVRQSIRPSDVISRYGGEEFVILLPETSLDYAVQVMTRVQRELTRKFFLHNNEHVLITFSAGVSQRIPGELQDDLLSRADRALYRAKQAGKNRVMPG